MRQGTCRFWTVHLMLRAFSVLTSSTWETLPTRHTFSVNTTPQMTCFSQCKSVHKMATGKSDDELIQLDNKMRNWTRSGQFRSGKSRIVYGLVTKDDADVNDNIHDCVTLHDADVNDNIHDCVALHDAWTDHWPLPLTSIMLERAWSARIVSFSSCPQCHIICTRTAAQVLSLSCHLHGRLHVSVSLHLDSPFLFLALPHVPYLEFPGKPAHSAKRECGLHRRVLLLHRL